MGYKDREQVPQTPRYAEEPTAEEWRLSAERRKEKAERMETIHDLIEDDFPKNLNPWDWRVSSPMGIDDEPVLTVKTKQESTEPWIEHRYLISLTKISSPEEEPTRRIKTANTLTSHTLKCAKEKLEIYRDYSDGAYHGGIEHTALIAMIDRTLSVLATPPKPEPPPDIIFKETDTS